MLDSVRKIVSFHLLYGCMQQRSEKYFGLWLLVTILGLVGDGKRGRSCRFSAGGRLHAQVGTR